MNEKQSGLETWTFINSLQSKHESLEGTLPFILAVAGSLGIIPFAVLRFMHGEYVMAFIDVVLIIGMMILGTFVYRTQQVRPVSIALSFLCVVGVLLSVHASGTRQVLWAYPAVMAIFYLLRPIEAIALVLAMISALLPKLLQVSSSFQATSVVTTLLLMGAFAYSFASVTNRQRTLLTHLANKDPLTGVGNRRALDDKIRDVVASNDRNPVPSSLIILDLDHFKEVNDAHGHAKGDEILRRITEIVNLRIRVTDSLYRIGGEEFVVVVEHQNIDKASHLAEQLRTLVEANELVPDHPVTISLGVAELATGEAGGNWLRRADEALYAAKRAGRNATALAEEMVA